MIKETKRWVRWRLAGRPEPDPFLCDLIKHMTQAITPFSPIMVQISGSAAKAKAEFLKMNQLLAQGGWGAGPYGDA